MITGIVAPVVSVALEGVEGAHVAGVQAGAAAAAEGRPHAAARRTGAAREAVMAVGQAAAGRSEAVGLADR